MDIFFVNLDAKFRRDIDDVAVAGSLFSYFLGLYGDHSIDL